MNVNKHYCLVALLLVMCLQISAQQHIEQEHKSWNKYKLQNLMRINLGFSGLGLSYELPIRYNFIIEPEIGLGAGYKINQNFTYRCRIDDPSFYASLAGKYYYKLDGLSNRNVIYNKGVFWGFKAKYTSKSIKYKQMWNTMLIATHWGMQRQLYKRLTFQLTMGVGAAIDMEEIKDTYVVIYPDINFKFSYALPF